MNRLTRIRSGLMGRRGLSASSSAPALENSNFDPMILQKQREIVQLVAEASKNGNPAPTNYNNQIQHRQKELDELVESKKKSMKKEGKTAATSTSGETKIKRIPSVVAKLDYHPTSYPNS